MIGKGKKTKERKQTRKENKSGRIQYRINYSGPLPFATSFLSACLRFPPSNVIMSDDDFMQASDEEYDFEYEDDEDEAQDSGSIDIENKYYNAKQLKAADPEDAVDEFLAIPALEKEKGEWGFKGLKQAVKLEFRLGRYDKVRRPWRR